MGPYPPLLPSLSTNQTQATSCLPQLCNDCVHKNTYYVMERVTTPSISQGIQSLSIHHLGCAGLQQGYGSTWLTGPCSWHRSSSCPINGSAVISSVQTTPKPLLPFSSPAHTGHSPLLWRNWKFWYASHTLTKFWPPLLSVMSIQVSYRRLHVPSRLSQSWDLFEALE